MARKADTVAARSVDHPGTDPLARSRAVSRVLDDLVTIPGTNIGIGLDALFGLVPGIGDSASTVLSTAILVEAVRHRVPIPVLMRMGLNLLVDTLIGYLPGIGDIADIGFRANRMNAKLLRQCVESGRQVDGGTRAYLVAATATVIAIVAMLVVSLVFTLWLLWKLLSGLA